MRPCDAVGGGRRRQTAGKDRGRFPDGQTGAASWRRLSCRGDLIGGRGYSMAGERWRHPCGCGGMIAESLRRSARSWHLPFAVRFFMAYPLPCPCPVPALGVFPCRPLSVWRWRLSLPVCALRCPSLPLLLSAWRRVRPVLCPVPCGCTRLGLGFPPASMQGKA